MRLLVIGTGGLAREFVGYFSYAIEDLAFLSNNTEEHRKYGLKGRLFQNPEEALDGGYSSAVIAIGSSVAKERINKELESIGFTFPSLIHDTARVATEATLGVGVVVSPQSIVGPNARILNFCYVNFQVGIGHDAKIGNYCQINPGVQIGGNTSIGDSTLLGSNATILQDKAVAANSTIVSGSVLMSSTRKSHTMIGIPARPLKLGA